MATATIQQAAAIPFRAVQTKIPQSTLAAIVRLRQEIAAVESKLHAAEGQVRAALESGASVEPGILSARIETTERRSVAWKEVALRLAERCGLNPSAYAANVLAHTKPTLSTRLVLEA